MSIQTEGPFFKVKHQVMKIGDGYTGVVQFRPGPGRRDMRPDFITDDDLALLGFVDKERNVTYESHNFWVQFDKNPRNGKNWGATITVMHGGGVEQLIVRDMVADAIELVAQADERAAFKLCWGLFEVARDAHTAGCKETRSKCFEAFVDGRLKKRKKPGQDVHKVWIEDKAR